jgi:hypothetical protein
VFDANEENSALAQEIARDKVKLKTARWLFRAKGVEPEIKSAQVAAA